MNDRSATALQKTSTRVLRTRFSTWRHRSNNLEEDEGGNVTSESIRGGFNSPHVPKAAPVPAAAAATKSTKIKLLNKTSIGACMSAELEETGRQRCNSLSSASATFRTQRFWLGHRTPVSRDGQSQGNHPLQMQLQEM